MANGIDPHQTSGNGRISAGGVEKDVSFVAIPADDDATNSVVDHSYLSKYAGSYAAATMSTETLRRTMIEGVPA